MQIRTPRTRDFRENERWQQVVSDHVSSHDGENVYFYREELADDKSFVLPDLPYGGKGFVVVGDNEQHAEFTINAAGTVNLIIVSPEIVANADTDAKFCIGIAATSPVTVKNRLGSSKRVVFKVWY